MFNRIVVGTILLSAPAWFGCGEENSASNSGSGSGTAAVSGTAVPSSIGSASRSGSPTGTGPTKPAAGVVGNVLDGVLDDADKRAMKVQIGLFKTPIEVYHLTFRKYPSSLKDLVEAPADVDPMKWKSNIGPMFSTRSLPKDAWGREFQYAAPGKHNVNGYDVWSNGPDGAAGTGDDIGNWETGK